MAPKRKIVHISFGHIARNGDPHSFLKKICYFTGVLKEQARSHDVTSVYFLGEGSRFMQDGVDYIFFKSSWLRRILPFSLFSLFRMAAPDVIVVHGTHFSIQTFLVRVLAPGKCLVFAQHHAEVTYGIKAALQRLTDRFINGYFFVSRLQSPSWLAEFSEKVHEVMEVSSVFRGVAKQEARKVLGLGAERVFLWVGRLDKNKDPVTAIKAFSRFCKSQGGARLFVAFQSDELLEKVKAIPEVQPPTITLLGHVEHEQLERWYSAADFIISTSHDEGSGVAVCEAMSCGCIPIVTNIPSFRMMTGDGSVGLLFSPGSDDELFLQLCRTESIVVETESERTHAYFNQHLSFEAIALRIDGIIQKELHKLEG